uniref:LIM zinc-binding domain-containing protein n=1 Tax=Strigamia maritima TaxID=126957 RepID=T1JEY1_STRMM
MLKPAQAQTSISRPFPDVHSSHEAPSSDTTLQQLGKMIMETKSEVQKAIGGLHHQNNECAGCKKRIGDRYMLKALDMFWHEDCLKCACCDCRLGEVGSTLFTKANLILCKRDYLRLFGTTGYCSACSKMIPAFEMVMRARGNVYHLECFACQQCNHRFCVGDRFYLCENKILCEYDYEERQVFCHVPSSTFPCNSVEHMKHQAQHLQVKREEGPTRFVSTSESVT